MAKDTVQSASDLGLDVDQDAHEAPTDDEVSTVMARIKAARSAVASPVDFQKYDQAQQQARDLYKDQANRSEWLSLADRIGTAATKFAAAAAGQKSHVDLSHIDTGPGYDVNGVIDRASKDYSTELGRIQTNKADDLRRQQEDYGLGERALTDVTNEKKVKGMNAREDKREVARAAEAKAAREFTAGRDDARAAQQTKSQAALFGQQQELQQNQLTQKEQFEQDRENRRLRDADVKDLDGQMKGAASQYQARQQLFNNLMNDGDLGKKSKDKLQADYGKQAAAAGVDLADIQSQLAGQETTRPSWLGGKSAEEEKAGKQAILKQSLTETKNLLDALRDRKSARLRSNPAGTQSPSKVESEGDDDETDAPPELVKVQGPSGTVASMPAEKAKKYLSQPGYKLVE